MRDGYETRPGHRRTHPLPPSPVSGRLCLLRPPASLLLPALVVGREGRAFGRWSPFRTRSSTCRRAAVESSMPGSRKSVSASPAVPSRAPLSSGSYASSSSLGHGREIALSESSPSLDLRAPTIRSASRPGPPPPPPPPSEGRAPNELLLAAGRQIGRIAIA